MTADSSSAFPTLGRYELVHLLGQGGMGEVYLAKLSGAAGFEKPCIVKTILPSLLSDAQFLDRFQHEARVLVHLVHSNIAQVHDMGQHGDTYFMALEYVAGVDLAQLEEAARMQRIQIPLPIVLYVVQKIAEGLGYAHRKAGSDGQSLGIVHRDVSPQNVMVSYEGEVKVIDFGLAKSSARSKHTLPSTVMGKLGYMSPEQVRGDAVDARTDIYSLGVVLWEMLAGRPLVPHGTMGEMMAAMMNPKIPSLSEIRPEVTPAIEALVRKALALNPADRYARAEELARALNEQLVRSGSPVGAEEVGNFVKQLCPEALAAQRKLISKLSMLGKHRPAAGGSHLPAPVTELADGYEGTFIRTPAPGTAPHPIRLTTPAGAAPKTTPAPAAQAPAPTAQRSPGAGKWVAAAVVLLGVAGAGAAYVLTSGRNAPGGSGPGAGPAQAAAAAVEPAPVPSAPAPQPAQPAPTVAALPEPAPAVPEEPNRSKPGTLVTVKKSADVVTNRSGVFVKAGSGDHLEPGMTLEVVGPRQKKKGEQRTLLGTATVVEVWPKLARVTLDPDAAGAKGARFASLPLVARPRAAVKPAAVASTPRAPSTTAAPSAAPSGTKTAQAAPGAPAANTSAPTAAAPTASAPAAPAPAPVVTAPAPSPVPAAKKVELNGRISVTGGLAGRVTLYNTDEFLWTDCTLTIPGRRAVRFNGLGQGGKRDFSFPYFRPDASVREMPANRAELVCKEGSAEFGARF